MMMKEAVCTLFEVNYAPGVAALVNSLVRSGFHGIVYAGYRGFVPSWNLDALAAAGVELRLVALSTSYHLTNFKPEFMLDVFRSNSELTHLCYIDPDIVLTSPWSYIQQWLTCGVGLCEDVNSPLSSGHPRRIGWRRHFSAMTRPMNCRTELYVNGGFVGVSRNDIEFLETWCELTITMGSIIGGLDGAKLQQAKALQFTGFAECFDCTDQDALNAAIEVTTSSLSILGRSAMCFAEGSVVMPHAIGPSKPWQRNFVRMALQGFPPRFVDKVFLMNVSGPLPVYSRLKLHYLRLQVGIAVLICRVWRR